MRDLARIDAVLAALKEAWVQQPDLRLGQLVVIAAKPKDPCLPVFNLEDEAFLQGLAEYQSLRKRGA
jgi:hypothetical protein